MISKVNSERYPSKKNTYSLFVKKNILLKRYIGYMWKPILTVAARNKRLGKFLRNFRKTRVVQTFF